MSNNKDMNPNRNNLDNISSKGSLNDEMNKNRDMNPNRNNLDNISSKDSLNTEIGKNKDTNNSDNIRPKETDNTSNSNLDTLNNKIKGENLVGKMENRTIGEYAKDKFKSSKFIDDLNRSYNLGKNSSSKWNIKRKKNKN